MESPGEQVKERVNSVFRARNVLAMSREIGIPVSTLRYWKTHPLSIPAVELFRLENIFGGNQ